MSAEVDGVCGVGYRQCSNERVNRRNGYRARDWDARASTVELAIAKPRPGSYIPESLLERRRRAEQARVSVVGGGHLVQQSPGATGQGDPGAASRWSGSFPTRAGIVRLVGPVLIEQTNE